MELYHDILLSKIDSLVNKTISILETDGIYDAQIFLDELIASGLPQDASKKINSAIKIRKKKLFTVKDSAYPAKSTNKKSNIEKVYERSEKQSQKQQKYLNRVNEKSIKQQNQHLSWQQKELEIAKVEHTMQFKQTVSNSKPKVATDKNIKMHHDKKLKSADEIVIQIYTFLENENFKSAIKLFKKNETFLKKRLNSDTFETLEQSIELYALDNNN